MRLPGEVDTVVKDLNRATGARLSRRGMLRLVAASGLASAAGALLAACGGGSSSPTPGGGADNPSSGGTTTTETNTPVPTEAADEGTPKKGGVWRFALTTTPSLNPITQAQLLPDTLTFKVMYNSLVKYKLSDDGQTIEIVPDLAEAWEASADASAYTFHVRDDVTWHDGERFTVDDVKFTIDSILDPANNAQQRRYIATIDSVEIVDDRTVTLTLVSPFAFLPVMLGFNVPMVPKHLLDGQNLQEPAEFLSNPVGTGPFKFKEAAQGSHVSTVANPDYFEGAPHLDGIDFVVIPDTNAQVARFLAGDLDFIAIEPDQLDAVEGQPDVTVRFAPQVRYFYLTFNHERPLFQDVRVRQALNYAIDKEALVERVLNGGGQVATGPISPLLGAVFNPDVRTYPYDMEEAARLLEEAGWTKGSDGVLVNAQGERFAFQIDAPSNYPLMIQVATYAQAQYKQLGGEVELRVSQWPVFNEYFFNTDYDMMIYWYVTPPSPDIYSQYATEAQNYFNYSNPQVDQLIEGARTEPDEATRNELYHQLQEALAEDLPVIFLYYPQEVQIMRRTHDLPLIGYRDALTWMQNVWLE